MTAVAVSVLMPAYNAEHTLPLALRSVQRQTFRNWECVVVDDGSSDGTAALVSDLSRDDARFRLCSSEHAGIVPALNRGLNECRGAYVARLDADDFMRRRRLEKQHAFALANPALGALGCHVRLVPHFRAARGRHGYERWLNSLSSEEAVRRDRFVECPLAHPSFFLRRELLERYPYRDTEWAEDYDLLLRLFAAGVRVGVVPERLLFWRESPGRLSRVDGRYSLANFVRCKAHFLAQGFLAPANEYVLWGYGDTGRNLSRALALHGKHPSHIVELHPGRIGQRILNAEVIWPEMLAARSPRPERILVSVSGGVARSEIRARLRSYGFVEERDFLCAA